MKTEIRLYQPSDLSALYNICLQTANSGKDATHLLSYPKLVGDLYAAPYAVFEPDLCFVVTCSGKPSGYILGTRDSEKFYQCCAIEWFPKLREKYPLPSVNDNSWDAPIIRLIYKDRVIKKELEDYPAHLHIDLLPEIHGQGIGRDLMHTFLNRLRKFGVPAVHLEVGGTNLGAIKYYQKMGFQIIKEYERSIAFGKKL